MARPEELELVRQEYRASLADLTFNSKPIITNLTIIAQENMHAAPAIVQAIEDHIRIAHPKQKLFVMYLLDSICKNVGGRYIELFARNLVRTFSNTFEAVSAEDKTRLQKLFVTWKSSPTGPLFSSQIVGQLDQTIAHAMSSGRRMSGGPIHINPNFVNYGGRQQQPPASYRNDYPRQDRYQSSDYRAPSKDYRNQPVRTTYQSSAPIPAPTSSLSEASLQPSILSNPALNAAISAAPLTATPSIAAATLSSAPDGKALLQQQIQALLAQKQQRALTNPADVNNNNQIQVLTQLLLLVQTTLLDQTQMLQITNQIQQMYAQPTPTPLSTSLLYPLAGATDPTATAANLLAATSFGSNTTSLASSTRSLLSTSSSTPLGTLPTPVSGVGATGGVPDASNLVSNLMKFGLLGTGTQGTQGVQTLSSLLG
ncbi:hypothetical protein HK102_004180, partial [Quaeritorhiza haematococci]